MHTIIENNLKQHNYISNKITFTYFNKPFNYLIIDNLFNETIYDEISKKFKLFIDRTIPYKDQPGATSNYEGYISGLSLNDCIDGYDFFISDELQTFTENVFDIKTTKYMSPSAHFHKSPSKNGFIHRDMNICSFKKENKLKVLNNCSYTDDSLNKQPETEKVIRSIAFLYYLNNPKDLTNYYGGGTGLYDSYGGNKIDEIKPINNRLFMFEISHNSFHSYIGSDFDRSCVVSWYHSSPAYIINRHWKQYYKMAKKNQSLVERWGNNPLGGFWPIEKDPNYKKYFNSSLDQLVNN
jgi:Rps23 Pro-64 3,4-dihydroxylase Tpa1-like proline 4-hydroxylase